MGSMKDYVGSLFLKELLKGMALTGRHLFARKITVQFPEEKTPQSLLRVRRRCDGGGSRHDPVAVTLGLVDEDPVRRAMIPIKTPTGAAASDCWSTVWAAPKKTAVMMTPPALPSDLRKPERMTPRNVNSSQIAGKTASNKTVRTIDGDSAIQRETSPSCSSTPAGKG